MTAPSAAAGGFLGSLRRLGDSLLAGLQGRVTLFSLELQEEKFRLIQIFVWISATVFTGMMAAVCLSLTLVFCFPSGSRLAVLGSLAGFYTAAAVVLVIAFRRYLARQPVPFAATLEEIAADRAALDPAR